MATPNYLDKVKAYWAPPPGYTERKEVEAHDEHGRKFTKVIDIVRATTEMHVMQYADYVSAKKRFPKEWSLEPPKDAEVIDKTPIDLSEAGEEDERLAAPIPDSPPIVKRGAVKNPI